MSKIKTLFNMGTRRQQNGCIKSVKVANHIGYFWGELAKDDDDLAQRVSNVLGESVSEIEEKATDYNDCQDFALLKNLMRGFQEGVSGAEVEVDREELENEEECFHVDNFVKFGYPKSPDSGYRGDVTWARWCLMLFRLPATLERVFHFQIRDLRLYCEYRGVKYRCNGASRLGDVYLTEDFTKEVGYSKRVSVEDCYCWS